MDAGEVTSISVLGRLVVFINSARVAKNLFEQTGALYMDRPAIPIIDMYAKCLVFVEAPRCLRVSEQDGSTFQSCHHALWSQVARRATYHRPKSPSGHRCDVPTNADRQGTCISEAGPAVSREYAGVSQTVRRTVFALADVCVW